MTWGRRPEVIVRREARVSTRVNDASQAWQRRRRAGTARNRTAFRRGSGASPCYSARPRASPLPPGEGGPKGRVRVRRVREPPGKRSAELARARVHGRMHPDLRPPRACAGGWKAEGYGGGGGSERWGFDARCARSDCSGFSFACWRSGLGFHAPRIGRDGEIRTHDPQHPMLVRYQTALRPDRAKNPHCNRAAPGWRAGRRVSGAGCTGLPRVRGVPA